MKCVMACGAAWCICAAPAALAQAEHASGSKAPPADQAAPATSEAKVTEGDTPEAAAPTGILPLVNYGGDLLERPRLLGDLWGARTGLAERGFQFGVDFTQAMQSVVDGGRDTTTRYGGSLDYTMSLDLDRMGAVPGGLVKFRAASRYGASVNGASGLLLPVYSNGFTPLTDELDEDIAFTITDLNYTQFLSPTFGVFVGKFNTLDGDANEFAAGRGVSQFFNSEFVFNSAMALSVPYSTLGVGAVWAPDPNVQLTVTLANLQDSSTTTGFDDFGEGYLVSGEAWWQYRLGALPGGMMLSGLYAGDTDFASLGSRLVFRPGEGLSIPTEDDTWAIAWNGWQYVLTEEEAEDRPLNLLDGAPDLQGIGLFARFGFADRDTNPVEWSLSGGVGGRGAIPGRDRDVFGVGYFYNSIVEGRLLGAAGVDDESEGFEAFYNVSITPAAELTLDAQWTHSPLPGADDAVILGLRLRLRF